LAVICSAAENLADGVVERQTQIQRYGSLIRDEGRRLGNMVEQVLEFAGAQSGRQVYELRPVAAREVVHDALTPFRPQFEAEDWRVETDVAEGLPPVQADAPALARALQNLVGNALKYSNGERWLRVAAERQGDFVAFSVTDRGRGIPAEELRRIFEPFTRGREAVAEQIHGNGLGLSLVKHIAQAHGGRVEVTSELNKGSTFTLYVPVASV
jgi:signal transduction histidine kinase